jgi:hypothetical protein
LTSTRFEGEPGLKYRDSSTIEIASRGFSAIAAFDKAPVHSGLAGSKKFQEIPIALRRTSQATFRQIAGVCHANRQEHLQDETDDDHH